MRTNMNMSAWLAPAARCNRGSVAILFAFVLVPIVAAAGLAIDFGRAVYARGALQSATDAAALSGANRNVATADKTTTAASVFTANVSQNPIATGAVPVVALDFDKITVSTTYSVRTTLARVLGHNSLQISATSSVALAKSFGGGAPACVIALSTTADGAFYVNGTTDFEAINCSVYSNSAAAESIRAVGSPTVSATSFCTVGGFDITSNFLPTPITGCSPLPDPFTGLTAPTMDDCEGGENVQKLKKGTHTLEPGTFCGGLELMAQANVTLEPGVYVVRSGPLIFRSGSSSIGDGVVFYLTGSDALMKVNGGADVDIKAPTSGSFAGIVAVQDKNANAGATSIIQGGGTVKLIGGLYFPTQTVEISGNGDLGQDVSSWAIVADQVHLKGNGSVRIEANFTGAGFPNIVALPSNVGPRILN